MNRQDVIVKLIEELHSMLPRPALNIGETSVHATQTYLSGMQMACWAMGIIFSLDIQRKATKSRGWEFYANTGLYLRERGLSEEQIVQELLLIEIRMLELVAEGLAD